MKKTEMLIGVLLTLGCVACSQAPPAATAETKAPDTKAKDLDDIKSLEDRFLTAFKAKDVNAIMSVYIPDESLFVFDATPPRQFVGAQAYRKDWEAFMAVYPGPIDVELTDLDVTVGGGDIAFGHSIQRVSGKVKDGKMLEGTVRVTDCYKRVNGQWLVAHEHVSFPVDMMTGKADLSSKP